MCVLRTLAPQVSAQRVNKLYYSYARVNVRAWRLQALDLIGAEKTTYMFIYMCSLAPQLPLKPTSFPSCTSSTNEFIC